MPQFAHRVMVYVDGFNLYYGLRSRGWRRYYWLDLWRLSMQLLRAGQTLGGVRYFTASVSAEPDDPDKPLRQAAYLDALGTLPDLTIHRGYFLPKRLVCKQCGASWQSYEEKMTDVNIAAELLDDAQDGAFDTAIIISADGDLTSPVERVLKRYPGKRIVVAFPPGRHSVSLRNAATSTIAIGRAALRDSQFPDRVIRQNGYLLTRPPGWR